MSRENAKSCLARLCRFCDFPSSMSCTFCQSSVETSRCVDARVLLPDPIEIAGVDPVPEDQVDVRLDERLFAPRLDEPGVTFSDILISFVAYVASRPYSL